MGMMENSQHQGQASVRLRDWLWRPWHAKLWWAAVPVYWLGRLASLRSEAVAEFYHSALAGHLNVIFFPPLVALILSYGFLKRWLALLPAVEEGAIDEDEFWPRRRYGPSRMPKEFDPLDPASGALWVGSTLNPTNPGYVNRAS